jgi:transcriptional regulator with XRE-family HTH domain
MDIFTVGQVIRERRQQLNLSQEQLSQQSQVAIKTIHAIELGKGNPAFRTLEALLEVLGLEVIVISKKN